MESQLSIPNFPKILKRYLQEERNIMSGRHSVCKRGFGGNYPKDRERQGELHRTHGGGSFRQGKIGRTALGHTVEALDRERQGGLH